MTVFRRRRRAEGPTGEPGPDETGPESAEATAGDSPGPAATNSTEDRSEGPWDISEVEDPAAGGRLDLGGLWMPGRAGMELRAEVDQQTQQVASVAAVLGRSAVQLQAFAAPRTEGIWGEVRREIAEGVSGQGGRIEEVRGTFGAELRAELPVRQPDGTAGTQVVRFTGVDGPRWFLRAVFSGEAASDPAAAAPLEEIVRGVVVVRGSAAMAPREPIPLRLPQQEPTRPPEAAEQDVLRPFARGPEITEVR